jgi:hypothetical protein
MVAAKSKQSRADRVYVYLQENIPHDVRPNALAVADALRMTREQVYGAFKHLRDQHRWHWPILTAEQSRAIAREVGRQTRELPPPTEDKIAEECRVIQEEIRKAPARGPVKLRITERRPDQPWDFHAERAWRERFITRAILDLFRIYGGMMSAEIRRERKARA